MSVSHKARVFKLETELLLTVCENIGSPRSLAVASLAKAGQWKDILELSCDWRHYDNYQRFADDYLVTSIMSKNPRLPTATDLSKVAIDKFLGAEAVCKETNLRIDRFERGEISPPLDVLRALHGAREYIRRILGPLTRSDLRFAEDHMRFGPGATTSVSGVVTQGKKYCPRVLDTTPRLLDFGLFCLPPGWRSSVVGFRQRTSSKLTTVPKNAKTDRVICIEPDLNIYVQLGIGALIREKLRLFGLDLNSQLKNQSLASKADKDSLCTVDLSAASDTVSRAVVWNLLPERWAELLHMARVDSVDLNGEEIRLEKWSSMGNGYTFELESILFYGILLGCREVNGWDSRDVTVYGDDLVMPLEDLDLVTRTLDFLGFKVNVEKSFGKGRFHESCGTDWFDGHNVRPFFFRSDHHDYATVCYVYGNSLRRWALRCNNGDSCDRRLLPAWLRCFTAVDVKDRHRIPEGFGDVGFIENFDRSIPTVKRRKGFPFQRGPRADHPLGWATYEFSYRSNEARRLVISEQGCLTAFLNGVTTLFSHASESLRGRFRPATTRMGQTLDWPNLGPWS